MCLERGVELRGLNMRFFSVLVLCVLASSAFARDVTGKIANLVSWKDGHSWVVIENGPANGCSDAYSYSLGTWGQDARAQNMLSVALAAFMAGRSVHLSTANGVCDGGQEQVTFIELISGS